MKDMILGMAKRSLLFGCMLGSVTAAVQAQTDGIFAEFSTSMGSFTCQVDYAKSPKASANFIGLATGQRSWLDPVTGVVVAKPYFDEEIFHRVIAGFVIQSGSPDGSPSGGPGYTFQDEFDPDLRHDAFGVLSMANSGADANGSQFFITVAARPDLDDRYTIFGRVVGGSNAVQAINGVETDSSDRPLTNVVLESVRIRRVGSAAQLFDIQAQGLPFVSGLEATLAKTSTNVVLSYTNGLGQDTRLYTSANLANWTGSKLGIETTPPVFTGVYVNMMAPRRFYRMAKINYPGSLSVPESVANLTLTFSFSAYFGTIVMLLDGAGSGIYSQDGGAVGGLSYTWVQDAYRGRLSPIVFTGVMPMKLDLGFNSTTNGSFKGTAFPNYPSSAGAGLVSGTFTASP